MTLCLLVAYLPYGSKVSRRRLVRVFYVKRTAQYSSVLTILHQYVTLVYQIKGVACGRCARLVVKRPLPWQLSVVITWSQLARNEVPRSTVCYLMMSLSEST